MIYLQITWSLDPKPIENPIYLESKLDAPKLARTSLPTAIMTCLEEYTSEGTCKIKVLLLQSSFACE
jgi:hypothetical protein